MSNESARFVPKLLDPNLKRTRFNMSRKHIVSFDADPNSSFQRFVNMDKTWVHHLQPETKKQWKHIGTPSKETKTGMSVGKVMAFVFWDADGVVVVDVLDKGHSITGAYYNDLLRQLLGKIKQIRRGKLRSAQCYGTHVHGSHGYYPEIWIPTCRRPTLFS